VTLATWEQEAFEDAFPELGTTYVLRPMGNEPVVVVKQGRGGGTYSQLQCTFWAYQGVDPSEPQITSQTDLIVLKRDFYPSVLHDFIGRWHSDSIFVCEAVKVGKATRLKVKKQIKLSTPNQTPTPPETGPPNPAAVTNSTSDRPADDGVVHVVSSSGGGKPGAGGLSDQQKYPVIEEPPAALCQPEQDCPSCTTYDTCEDPRRYPTPPAAPCSQCLRAKSDGWEFCPVCGERVG
jgi:hypothetical protein